MTEWWRSDSWIDGEQKVEEPTFNERLKKRSCSKLPSGIIEALEMFDSWIVNALKLKNMEFSQI